MVSIHFLPVPPNQPFIRKIVNGSRKAGPSLIKMYTSSYGFRHNIISLNILSYK